MANNINFDKDIKSLRSELEQAENELEELESKWAAYDSEVTELRTSLENLKMALDGKLPTGTQKPGLKPVARKKGSDRPKRGARKTQVVNICRSLGRRGETFRTKEVIDELRRIENDVTEGIRSYTYSLMDTLKEEGIVEKVGRGTWSLQ